MDRTALGRKTLNNQIPRTDRFVTPREVVSTYVHRRWLGQSSCDQQDIDNWHKKYSQRKEYTCHLNEALGLESLNSVSLKPKIQTWPCRPRKKSFLSAADNVLDLPNYRYAAFPDLLDWSKDNILVAALGKKYHKWCWGSQSCISQGLAQNIIYCCKYDPRGELLALGTTAQVEIHDHKRSKAVGITRCQCKKDYLCSITTLDWSPTGNSYVTGCSWGMVVSHTRSSNPISWRQVCDGAVLLVRVSPDARHLAVTTLNSPEVVLLSWPTLKMLSTLESKNWTVKTIAWHPWCSALLGVGVVTFEKRPHISLWNAASSKIQQRTIGHRPYSLDAMLFSHRTGELVLSLRNTDVPLMKQSSHLVVMSDPDTVVDRWDEGRSGLDLVRTMVFSPDGTKLGTATSDEDLIIWSFVPEDNRKNKKFNCKRFSAIPVYLDETTHGFSLR